MLDNAKPLKKLISCALCCVAAAAAVAAPPAGNNGGGLLGKASGLLAAAATHNAAKRLDFQRLDLRPPDALPGGRESGPIGDSQAVFPSAKRVPLGTAAADQADLPGGTRGTTLRMGNTVQEMARRVQHEGLPVARLWETKTALLHVGLSPRGKPGLWLIQKVP